jgi:hypothetical protein
VEIRELVATLGLNFSDEGFKAAEKAIKALKTGLGAAAAAVATIGAAVAATAYAVAEASELKDIQDAYGVTTKALQELGFAAKLSGAGVDEVRDALRFLSRNAVEAAGGSKEAMAAFRKLGITVKDSSGNIRGADELMMEMAAGLQRVTNPAERTALAMKLLGRGGGPLLAFLSQGTAGIQALRDEAVAMGIVFDEEFVESADVFGDNAERLTGYLKGLRNAAAKGFLPALAKIQDGLLAWLKANGALIRQGLSNTLEGLGNLVTGIAGAFKFVTDVIVGAGAAIWNFGTNGKLVIAALIPLTAYLIGPWALIGLGILFALASLEDLFVFLKGGDSVFSRFVDEAQRSGEAIKVTLGSIFAFFRALVMAFGDGGLSAMFKEVGGAITFALNAYGTSLSELWNTWTRSLFIAQDKLIASLRDFGFHIAEIFGSIGEAAWEKFLSTGIGKVFNLVGSGIGKFASDVVDSDLGKTVGAFGSDIVGSVMGTGLAPSPSVSSANTSLVNAPRVTIKANITAQPGDDGAQVAEQLTTKMDDYFSTQLRSTMSALTPAGG